MIPPVVGSAVPCARRCAARVPPAAPRLVSLPAETRVIRISDPLHNLYRPSRPAQVLRIHEYGRNSVLRVHALLLADARHVIGTIRHAGVLEHETTIRKQGEIRMPRAFALTIVNIQRTLVEEGYPVPIKKPAYLRFPAGLVRGFPRCQAVFEPRCAHLHASFTADTSLATLCAASISLCSPRSISVNSLALCACSFRAASSRSASFR